MSKLSTLLLNSQKAYEVMLLNAEAEEKSFDGYTGRIYRGKTTALFTENGISISDYSHIMNALKVMGCVVQIRRGGGSGGVSIWGLIKPPTEDLFDKVGGREGGGLYRQPVSKILAQNIRDVNTNLSTTAQDVDMLKGAFVALNAELESLKLRIKELENKND